jgi:hypothetical protein
MAVGRDRGLLEPGDSLNLDREPAGSIEMAAEVEPTVAGDDDRLFFRGLLYAVALCALCWGLVVTLLFS